MEYLSEPVKPDCFEIAPAEWFCRGLVERNSLLVASAAGRTAGGGLFLRLVAGAAGRTAGGGFFFRLVASATGRTAGDGLFIPTS